MTLAKTDGSTPPKTLLTVSPKTYESGIITQVLSIGETGEYRLHLSGKDGSQADFTLEIPITVGAQWYEGIAPFWLWQQFSTMFSEGFDPLPIF